MEKRKRRRFTAEYKAEAAKRLEESGKTLQAVAEELGVHPNQLRGWRNEHLAAGSAEAYLVTTHTPGFSAVQLQRQLGLGRYETAWAMLQRLRRAMLRPERDRLSGVVEVDEAYVGGVEEGRRGGRRRDSSKSIVVAAVEVRGRGSGRLRLGLRLAVVGDLSAASLAAFVEASVEPGGTVLTDGWGRATPRCARATTTGPRRWAATRGTPPSCSRASTGPSRTSRPG